MRLKKLTGIENTLPTEIGVTARISEKQIECTLRRLPIQADGLDDSLTATLSTATQPRSSRADMPLSRG